MKISMKPIAAAISLALISVSAHAAFGPPAQGAAVPADTGLYLEVYNSVSGATELVNLSYAYEDIADTNLANLNSTSATYTANVANPVPGGTGLVDQLNFGTIANASAFGSNSNYMVVSAAQNSETSIAGIEGVAITSSQSPSACTYACMNSLVLAVQQEIAAWASQTGAAGTFYDATGSTTASATNGPLTPSGNFNQGTLTVASLDTATAFYNILANTNTTTTDGLGAHKSSTTTYTGFWDLSSSGDLTYNIVASPVPLPAAVWLFGSGLLGLIGVGRRRAA